MECRQLAGKDAQEYWQLRVMGLKESPEAFATTWQEAISRKDAVEQTKQNLESDKSRSFGIFQDGKLIGSVTLVFEHYEKLRHKAVIVAMYVSPLSRKKGRGTILLRTAIKNGP
jgi:predicted acetyltransferase